MYRKQTLVNCFLDYGGVEMRIEFHGANKNVTGSCHLIECNSKRLLVDCGMFQGGRDMDEENKNDFGFDPAGIDFLILTHAHLDHVGAIIYLSNKYKAPIICTPYTAEVIKTIVKDERMHLRNEIKVLNVNSSYKISDNIKLEFVNVTHYGRIFGHIFVYYSDFLRKDEDLSSNHTTDGDTWLTKFSFFISIMIARKRFEPRRKILPEK